MPFARLPPASPTGQARRSGRKSEVVMAQPTRVKAKEKGGKITTAGRRALRRGQFALPDGDRPGVEGRYPIDTPERGRNALARVAQHGSSAEKSRVRAAVRRKYPSIGKSKGR